MKHMYIKHYIVVIILSFIFTEITAQSVGDSTAVMSLDECIAFALNENENIKNAYLEQQIAQTDVNGFLAQGLPQISGRVELTYNPVIQKTLIPAILFDPNAPEDATFAAEFGTQFSGNASVTFQQLIADGSFFIGLRAVRTYRELSRKETTRTEIDTKEAVSKAYYAVLINEEMVELMENNYNRLDTLLHETRIMYENGFVEKIDVDRIEVNFNNIKIEKEKTLRDLDLSYKLLKFQMGLPISAPILLRDKINAIKLDTSYIYGQNIDYKNRVEYSILETNHSLAGLDLQKNRAGYFPSLYAFAGVGANTGTNEFSELFNIKDNWFGNAAMGLRLNVPILDGFLKQSKIQKNKVQIKQLENQFKLLQKNIDLEVSQKQNNYQLSVQNLSLQEKNMHLAEQVYRITKIKYQEGVGSNLEVVEADNAFKQAQTNYYAAVYELLVTKIELEKALGILK